MERFLLAQETMYQTALNEVKTGKKTSHWMWFIFPQIVGLGQSEISVYFSIRSVYEAKAYLKHPILGKRLKEISSVLLMLKSSDAEQIFGKTDAMKLHSCMTLFHLVGGGLIFQAVLDKFFDGNLDKATVRILKSQRAL